MSHQRLSRGLVLSSPQRLLVRAALVAATALSILGANTATAAEGDSNQALLEKLEKMEQRIELLEAELKQRKQAPSAPEKSTAAVLKDATPSDKNAKSSTGSAPTAPPAKNPKPASPSDKPQEVAAKAPGMPSDAATPPADKPILGLAPSPATGLSIGAYGEVAFGGIQNPAALGQ